MALDKDTIEFSVLSEKAASDREILIKVYRALLEKGYDPIDQIVGYLLSEDPTYITNYNGARSLIGKLDRDDILNEMVRMYLGADKN